MQTLNFNNFRDGFQDDHPDIVGLSGVGAFYNQIIQKKIALRLRSPQESFGQGNIFFNSYYPIKKNAQYKKIQLQL